MRMCRSVANLVVLAGLVLGLADAVAQTPAKPAKVDSWWKHALIYEIYPRSFQDSNGDGVGDLNGITQRLDYLKGLGVDAIWLSPIYPSPQVDFGYDISNYEAIDRPYGTMADFDRLVAEAKKRNIRIIMDMVMNHTSDKHPWFIESASSKTNPKRDWYIWRDGKGPGEPPNNWQSTFGHSAWKWDPKTSQWYYHRFYAEQPDLNWRNPAVERAMFGVYRFWLNKGVAGFRLDAVPTLFEDEQLRDEKVLPGPMRTAIPISMTP
jgi:alpha-glucosidase